MGITAGGELSSAINASVQPQVINFGLTRVGDTNTRTFVIHNASDSAMLTGSLGSLTGPFALGATTATNFNVTAGNSAIGTVTFAPTAAGTYNGSLTVSYQGRDSVQTITVPLVAMAFDSARGVGNASAIALSRTHVDFGRTQVGQVTQQTISVTNPSATATMTGVIGNPVAPYAVASGAGEFSLAPGESRSVIVTYSPLYQGTFNDNIAVTYAGADSAGVSYVSLSGSAFLQTLDVTSDDAPSTGNGFVGVAPNPIASSAMIHIAVPTSAHSIVRIFDNRGSEVATLFDGELGAGSHSIRWDASGVPNGVYHARLISGPFHASQTLTVVR
jgi:hypothetical protein